jgi:TraM recognition site of TraD and TraG
MSFVKDLDTPLLRLSPQDNFTLRDACAGVHAFGGIGSGKSSGIGRMLAGAYMRAQMGGIVTIVKPGDIELWRRNAAEHGRSKSLVLFDENEGFNFLAYELGRQGMNGIGTVTECLMRVLEAAKKASPTASQKGEEPFWENSARMILRYSIPLVYSATGTLQIGELIRFITSAPADLKDVTDPEWQKRSFMYEVMEAAAQRPKVPMENSALYDAITYWSEQYPAIPDKTRGNIVITVTTTLDRFKHGRLNRAFCGRTTIVPELTFHGAIVVLAMPTSTWNEDGVIAQQLFKYMWQRAVLSRNSLPDEHRERPVFSFSDEAQETVNSYDGEFLSMCRESRCCVTYLTQSLPTYYAKMGGDNPRDAAHALVGKFNTHVYCSNACAETNEYASRTIGKVTTRRGNYSTGTSKSTNEGMTAGANENSGYSSNSGHSSTSPFGFGSNANFNSGSGHNSGSGSNWGSNRGRGTSENVSRGYSESIEYAIEPGDFARMLKTGGKPNGNRVTGIWFQGGRIFKASGNNFMLETFKQ